jgi:hypothetical protein
MLSRFELLDEDALLIDAQKRAHHSGRVLAIHPATGRALIVPYVPRGWDLLHLPPLPADPDAHELRLYRANNNKNADAVPAHLN